MNHSNITGTIVDVRTPEEFEDGHIKYAMNIPLDQVQLRVQEFKTMQKPVIAYCRSGTRSAMAVFILKQHGVEDAVNGGSINEMNELLKKLQ